MEGGPQREQEDLSTPGGAVPGGRGEQGHLDAAPVHSPRPFQPGVFPHAILNLDNSSLFQFCH